MSSGRPFLLASSTMQEALSVKREIRVLSFFEWEAILVEWEAIGSSFFEKEALLVERGARSIEEAWLTEEKRSTRCRTGGNVNHHS